MHIKTKYFAVSVLSLLLLSGCRIPALLPRQDLAPLPESYPEVPGDRIGVAPLQFQEFFTDPHLQDLIRNVWDHNLEHRMADRQLAIAEAYLKVRKGALLPAIQADVRASGTRYGAYTMEGVGNFDTNLSPNIEDGQRINTTVSPDYFLGLNAVWEADLWGRLRQMKKAARMRFLATEKGRSLLRSALTTQTAILYYELITLDKEVLLLHEHIALQQQALDVVTVQREVGRATELAVQQFQAQLLHTKASLYASRQQIAVAEGKLRVLMGDYTAPIVRSADFAVEGLRHLLALGDPRLLLQYRPDIMADYYELEASRADAVAVRAAFFPTLKVSAYLGLHSFNPQQIVNPASIVAQLLGGLTAPIFQQYQLRSAFKVAQAQQEIAFLHYQQTVNTAFQEVRTIASHMANNRNVLELKAQESAALKRSVDIANEMYLAAYASYLEIIAAQKSKLIADMDLLRAQQEQMHIMIRLYKALGGGWQ